ncbi:MAG TPA: hypothetical protein VGT61_15210 [Thermomicrobiales bacterium]|nr:hypothetical protein [Thermomicrobiales bacterium]
MTGARNQDESLLNLPQVARLARAELPALALLGLLASLGTVLVVGAAILVPPMSPFIAALALSPLYLAGTRFAMQILSNDGGGMRALLREFPRSWRTGVWIGFLPTLAVSILISTIEYRATMTTGADLMLVLIALEAAVILAFGFALVVVYPLAALSDLHGRQRWISAFALAGRHPAVSLGLSALLALLAVSVVYLGPVLLLVAIGPFCLLNAAVVRGPMLGTPSPDPLI